jgi:hypothetical protein
MVHSRREPDALRAAFRPACALVVAAALILPGCKPARRDDTAGRQTYELALGGSIGLSVDYQTGTIAAASTAPRMVLGFSTKDEKEVLSIDCSRLGGGEIAGKFRACLGGTEVEQGEFRCLYQHTREVVLVNKADSVKITDLRFIRVIE